MSEGGQQNLVPPVACEAFSEFAVANCGCAMDIDETPPPNVGISTLPPLTAAPIMLVDSMAPNRAPVATTPTTAPVAAEPVTGKPTRTAPTMLVDTMAPNTAPVATSKAPAASSAAISSQYVIGSAVVAWLAMVLVW